MNLIAYILIICFILSVIHLLYQYLVLPSLKQSLKNKFHKLNDEVISMVIDDKSKIKPLEFNFTIHIIEAGNDNISNFNLTSALTTRSFINDNDIEINSAKIEEIEKQIENERLKEIHNECLEIGFSAFIYNSAMLLIYLLPFFIVLYLVTKLFGYSKSIKSYYLNLINNSIESDFSTSKEQRQYCFK